MQKFLTACFDKIKIIFSNKTPQKDKLPIKNNPKAKTTAKNKGKAKKTAKEADVSEFFEI